MLPRQCSGYHRDCLQHYRSLMAVVVAVTMDFELEELREKGEGGEGGGEKMFSSCTGI